MIEAVRVCGWRSEDGFKKKKAVGQRERNHKSG